MEQKDSHFQCVVIGEQSLLIQCCEALLAKGHPLLAVVAENRRIAEWCARSGVPCLSDFNALRSATESTEIDYLFSITNLKMLPDWLLARPRRMAINFHDGPLPRYAGLNAPVWALIHGESEHGITWHQMEAGADTGAILTQRLFPVADDDTVFSLNARCYQEGAEAFSELIEHIEAGTLQPQPQDFTQRSYFALNQRPECAALLDWRRAAQPLERLIRALDFGTYANPVMLPKVDLGSVLLLARQAEIVEADPALDAGTIQAFDTDTLTVRCADAALKILRLTDLKGLPVDVAERLRTLGMGVGHPLPLPDAAWADALSQQVAERCKHEGFWRRRLRHMEPVELPFESKSAETGHVWREATLPSPIGAAAGSANALIAALALLFGRLAGKTAFSLAYVLSALTLESNPFAAFFASVVPLPVDLVLEAGLDRLLADIGAALAQAEQKVSYLSDLFARDPEINAVTDCTDFPIRVVQVADVTEAAAHQFAGTAALTVLVSERGEKLGFLADTSRLDRQGLTRLLDCLQVLQGQFASGDTRAIGEFDLLSAHDRDQLAAFNRSDADARVNEVSSACMHHLFERQATLTPEHDACIFEARHLSYGQLNEAANRLARHLQSQGVKTGDLVGVMVDRSEQMLVALMAVHKAGAAYVPLDPLYPRDRLAYMVEDAGLHTVITQRALAASIRAEHLIVLEDVADALNAYPAENLDVAVTPTDLAYVIYTSGSTGKPKGVMVEHRNVVNFFDGMDQRIETEPGVWLAVTSMSFDISVLELFWTLARGFTVVLYADAVRQKAVSPRAAGANRPIEFGFFYWNVAKDENEYDQQKYRLLLEGAKFADSHGFSSVWTPERHFAAFGGLFPNPSVTCAALATITSKVSLRAGSCVVPLHSPIRIAEEWAVVDNLSNGRVGLSIAAGWAAPDFAIKPDGFANAKQTMFEAADIVRRLWRGETVPFPGPQGEVQVRTLPRPIQKELPLWVTTAGNIDTYTQAAKLGANVLTHLLGQTLEEVSEKVRAYRRAWTEAGHSGKGTVTLMLHTFVGPDSDAVERAVHQPLKDYLKSAMFLVKSAAWQFPTFKKMSDEQGKTLDEFFATISDADMDALLEFAFQRYFHTSGLFGTPDSCLEMVDKVKAADVDEIACLIDFGIQTDVVLEHLPYLNELRAAAQQAMTVEAANDDADHSLPTLMQRHRITHFQCTPSMATMLVSDPTAQPGLAALRQMMVGGEAFPPDLAQSLARCVSGRVTNMYGPTETTIWSAVGDVSSAAVNNVSIGRPLPRQSVYILDDRQQPLPPGLAGELVIGGAGVVRGYWNRPDLTADRFLPDPFAGRSGARMYRTGDLARFLPDGRIECLGRVDHQVKIRGYRVELGEIEALLRGQRQVLEAAVVLREDTPSDKRLVAYLRMASGHALDAEALKTALRQQLPEFMVPSAYVELADLPLTPNGKIDRKALPAPKPVSVLVSTDSVPQSDTEAMVASIWQRVLHVPKVGTRDNFFDIGGHSLLVVQVLKELREKVTRPIQMTDLFKYTTVESLARFVGSEPTAAPSVDRSKERAQARRAAMNRRPSR